MLNCFECLMYVLFYHVCFIFSTSSNIIVESDLEDSATRLFEPEEWIGKGRKLPTSPNDIPQGLAEYFHSFNKRKKSTQNDIVDEDVDGEGE